METPYKKAWDRFKETPEFKELATGLIHNPPNHIHYAENRLRIAFDAGWNARDEYKLPGTTTSAQY